MAKLCHSLRVFSWTWNKEKSFGRLDTTEICSPSRFQSRPGGVEIKHNKRGYDPLGQSTRIPKLQSISTNTASSSRRRNQHLLRYSRTATASGAFHRRNPSPSATATGHRQVSTRSKGVLNKMRGANSAIPRIRKGDMVKVVWRDACEGLGGPSLVDLETSTLRHLVTSTVSTAGRYLRVVGNYLVLSEVLREESDDSLLYERRAQGKWLSIPLDVISEVTPLGSIDPFLIGEVRRRRTIFKQLRFIPRSKRLSNGHLSRMLYVA